MFNSSASSHISVSIEAPGSGIEADCERVLRTLPQWFGFEDALLHYARDADLLHSVVAREGGRIVAFLSLRQHFAQAWEIDCIAVQAESRGQGVGRLLHECAETWLRERGARILQVKTLAASHPSPGYAETRQFYERVGYLPIEVFPLLWAADLPVLQLIKVLGGGG